MEVGSFSHRSSASRSTFWITSSQPFFHVAVLNLILFLCSCNPIILVISYAVPLFYITRSYLSILSAKIFLIANDFSDMKTLSSHMPWGRVALGASGLGAYYKERVSCFSVAVCNASFFLASACVWGMQVGAQGRLRRNLTGQLACSGSPRAAAEQETVPQTWKRVYMLGSEN